MRNKQPTDELVSNSKHYAVDQVVRVRGSEECMSVRCCLQLFLANVRTYEIGGGGAAERNLAPHKLQDRILR